MRRSSPAGPAAGRRPGSVRPCLLRDLLDPGQLGGVVDRAQPGVRVRSGPHDDGLRALCEGFDDLGVEPGRGVDAFDRHADLPAVAERGPEQPVRDPVHVDVVQEDCGVVAAQFQGDPGQRGRRRFGDGPPGGHRAGEGDVADARVGGEAGTEGFAAGDDGQYVLRQGGGEDGAEQPGGEGVYGDGLRTMVLPAASAGANFAAASWRESSTARSRRRVRAVASGSRCARAGRR